MTVLDNSELSRDWDAAFSAEGLNDLPITSGHLRIAQQVSDPTLVHSLLVLQRVASADGVHRCRVAVYAEELDLLLPWTTAVFSGPQLSRQLTRVPVGRFTAGLLTRDALGAGPEALWLEPADEDPAPFWPTPVGPDLVRLRWLSLSERLEELLTADRQAEAQRRADAMAEAHWTRTAGERAARLAAEYARSLAAVAAAEDDLFDLGARVVPVVPYPEEQRPRRTPLKPVTPVRLWSL